MRSAPPAWEGWLLSESSARYGFAELSKARLHVVHQNLASGTGIGDRRDGGRQAVRHGHHVVAHHLAEGGDVLVYHGAIHQPFFLFVTVHLRYIAQHNQQPKPFVWTAKAADILAKVMRERAVLNTVQSG